MTPVRQITLVAAVAVVAACGPVACSPQPKPLTAEVPGYTDLGQHVAKHPVGMSQDQWIEMRNGIGEWERTGLIFGYTDDYGECVKAIDGLKAVNFDREYRCVPAN